MPTPEQAQALVQAGAAVMLVTLVLTIFVTGAREIWVWGRTLERSHKREELLRGENAALRNELNANTRALSEASAAFVKGLADLRSTFEREIDSLADELRWSQRDRGSDSDRVGDARRRRGSTDAT